MKLIPCVPCHGTGIVLHMGKRVACERCAGEGKVPADDYDDDDEENRDDMEEYLWPESIRWA